MSFLVDDTSRFMVTGGHWIGDSWVNFVLIDSMFINLSNISHFDGNKAVLVGSRYVGSVPTGAPISMELLSVAFTHEEEGRQFSTNDDYSFSINVGMGGFGVFVGWITSNSNVQIM